MSDYISDVTFNINGNAVTGAPIDSVHLIY